MVHTRDEESKVLGLKVAERSFEFAVNAGIIETKIELVHLEAYVLDFFL